VSAAVIVAAICAAPGIGVGGSSMFRWTSTSKSAGTTTVGYPTAGGAGLDDLAASDRPPAVHEDRARDTSRLAHRET
jgi:hypothetical protein